MNGLPSGWLEFSQFDEGGAKEKVRLRADTIVGIRPCGTAAYGTNIDVSGSPGIVQVEESPDVVWDAVRAALSRPPQPSSNADLPSASQS